MTSKHVAFYRVVETLGEPGCALCRLGRAVAGRFLDALLYEYVNDTGMRRLVVAAHGFCPNHSQSLVARHDALGTSILYKAILNHLRAELEKVTTVGKEDLMSRLREQLGGANVDNTQLAVHEVCPACEQRDEAALRAIALIGEHEAEPELVAALAESDGFCLPHLQMALARLEGKALEQVIAQQRAVWQGLEADLSEAIRKHDYRFRHEPIGEEGDAWRRAVETTAGLPGVF